MTYYILTYIKYYAILTHRVQTKVTRRGTPPWVYLFVWLFYLPGNFVEIVLVSKKAPRRSHCGGAEMRIIMKINGKITTATYKNIEELLTDNGYKIKYVAVECNGNIIPKNMYGKYVPGADDVIEVVTFVGGG